MNLSLDYTSVNEKPHDVKGLPDFYNLRVAFDKRWKKSKNKVLVIVGHVATGDLKNGAMLSDPLSKETYENVLSYAESYAKSVLDKKQAKAVSDHAYAFINFNGFKSYGLNPALYSTALKIFKKRVMSLIKQIKPDKILIVGDEAAETLIKFDQPIRLYRGWKFEIKGVPTWITIDIDRAFSPPNEGSNDLSDDAVDQANILGYAGRMMARIYGDSPIYKITVKPKAKVINSIRKFDKMMAKLKKKKAVAVDTETDSLDTFDTKMLVMQFGYTSDFGYVMPLEHADAKWTPEEMEYIRAELYEFFSQRMPYYSGPKTKYFIGQNIGYDLRIIRHWLRVRYTYWPLWDTQAGEFLLDENKKVLKNYGSPAYNLNQLCLSYQCDYYQVAGFSKAQRTTIAHVPLTEPGLLEYCFDPNTFVVTEKGKVPIRDIVHNLNGYGKILSYNHTTGENEWKAPVAGVERPNNQEMYELEYEGGTLRVTADHKVWSVTRNAYVAVKDLLEDEEILVSESAQAD